LNGGPSLRIIPRNLLPGRWDVPRLRQIWFWNRLHPQQMFVLSFLLLIALGTVGFKTLPGLYATERELTWTEALFTSTSAVCVTGLIVVDTATFFTFAGQAYLLLLIQLGGLGMIAFTSVIIVVLGRRLSLHHEELTVGSLATAPMVEHRRLILDVVRFTFTIELCGAVLLYLLWIPRFGWVGAWWHAVFHAVSAFCNAGFSTFSDSLETMQGNSAVLMVVMALITCGGVGFLTIEELWQGYLARRKKKVFRLSLHSRLVIWTSIALVVLSWPVFALLEWDVSLKNLPVFDKCVNSLFLSVTPRTAGFNNVPYSKATEASCFLTMLMMMIGGSPGSTAGGIKTTTFALLGVVAWSRLRGQRSPTIWNRSIRSETIDRTIGLVVIAFAVVMLGILVLAILEADPFGKSNFQAHSFEVVSAFNTVGLSMSQTSAFSEAGRMLLVALMFVGRVGPLTFAAAMAVRYARASNFRYAYEEVTVG
jgi:trk system potassium uptake protein TrkH